ncbi:MAG: mannose-6-phosphate isomerase, class I [Lentisphaeria bacterium]|nr:mannose-6-phosphate isomerase, class I [Lentisphaeria bacterium]
MFFRMENTIQNYDWGSTKLIQGLMDKPASESEKWAEVWMGAHPKAPSKVGDSDLATLIDENPIKFLGEATAKKFENRLPYMMKLLAAAKGLSIQAHPNKQQAEVGFKKENEAGIPIDAPYRNYKDNNHKPEVIVALSEFWGLNGFKLIEEMIVLLEEVNIAEFQIYLEALKNSKSRAEVTNLTKYILEMPETELSSAVNQLVAYAREHTYARPEYRWILKSYDEYGDDCGLFFILMLNLVHLQPGEGMFCNAGDLHAYLYGLGVELMANSDNVLRGGLTPKHIDVPELLSLLTFDCRKPALYLGDKLSEIERVYNCPVHEFYLRSVSLEHDETWLQNVLRSAEIIVCVKGEIMIQELENSEKIKLRQGQSIFISADSEGYELSGRGMLYIAATPIS